MGISEVSEKQKTEKRELRKSVKESVLTMARQLWRWWFFGYGVWLGLGVAMNEDASININLFVGSYSTLL